MVWLVEKILITVSISRVTLKNTVFHETHRKIQPDTPKLLMVLFLVTEFIKHYILSNYIFYIYCRKYK